ncbi:MAG TPA: hypothetical protein VK348_12120 [Planctomycetota bacterium]|nr:hypothetical protein [Planctomycetota bacterium]
MPTPTPDTNTTVLRGRVVAAETGLPLAGTIVHLQSEPEGSRGKEPDGWTEPADVITGDDGGFEIRFVPPPTRMFNLQFHEPERVARYVNWDSLRTGVTVDLGSVPMAFGAEVQFGVFDEQGRPRPGMSVWLHKVRQLEDDGPSTAEPDFAAPRTDTDGYAVCPAFSPGRWRYEIKDRPEAFGTILVGDKIGELEVVRQQTVSRTVVLRQPTNELSVSGVVHDAAGAPAAGLELAIFDIPQGRGYLPAMTADDGTFLAALAEPPDSNRRFRFALPDGAIDFELVDDGGEFAWGTHGLQVVVRRRQPASLELTVVDAATGAPVEDFGASCRGEGSDILPPSALQSSATAHHPGGVLRFDNLPPAPYRVSVQPKAPLCERAFIPIAVSEGRSTALQVALEPPAPLQVTVVDSSTQQPLPDVTVHLGRVIPEQHLDRVSLRTYRVPLTGSGGIPQYGNTTEVVTLDEATTRADGLVTLHAAPETPALVVIADGDRCVTTMLKDVRLPRAGNSLRIAVATAAILHGRLQPLQFLQHFGPSAQQVAEAARKAAVSLTVASDIADRYPELRLHSDAGVRMGTKVAADGTFTIAAIPPGRYEVFVAPSTQLAVDFSSNTDLGPLATVDMIGGEDQAIELTLDQYMPGIVRGRFLVDGVPWQGEVGFARLAGSHMQRYSLLADTNGTATSYWLLPGTYLAFAAVRQGYKTEYVLGPEPFVLTPNGEVDLTAMLHRRRIAVELRDANDQPVANRRLVLQWLEHPEFTYSLRHGEVTDAQGRLQFDPALPGRLCIRAFADGQSVEDDTPALVLGEASADATELTLRLPK